MNGAQWRFYVGLSVWGQWRHRFWSGGIQSEQLQVSYYELYYASLWSDA